MRLDIIEPTEDENCGTGLILGWRNGNYYGCSFTILGYGVQLGYEM